MNAHLLRQIFSTFLVAFTFLNGSYLFAQNTSITNGSWGTPANWSLGHVPLAAEDVVIAHNVTISAAATCANITIQTGKSLDLSDSNTLTAGKFMSFPLNKSNPVKSLYQEGKLAKKGKFLLIRLKEFITNYLMFIVQLVLDNWHV